MMNFIMMERRKMKKALLKKIPVVEAGIKDKQYMELCRQNYLLKVQKATVEHKRTLILNLYDAEDIKKEQYLPFCRIFFFSGDFITYFIRENRWSVKTLDILEAKKGKFISQIAIRTCKEKKRIKQFFHRADDAVDSIELIEIEQYKIKEERALERKKRMTKDIEYLFRSVKPVTRKFEKWLEHEVLKESQYIFYQYSRKKMIDCTCSHCKSEYQLEKSIPRHNKEYICPICKRKSIFKANGKAGYFVDQAEAVKIEKASDGIILRHFEVRKSYAAHGMGKYTLSHQEDYRAVFHEKFRFYYPVYSCLVHKYVWKEKYIDPYFYYKYHMNYTIKVYQTITQMPGMVYPYNLKNIFKETPFEYCSLDYFVKHNRSVEFPVVYYLKTYLKFPLLEQLVKQNMFYFALECLYHLPSEWKETKETNIRHLLGINSRFCSIMIKYNMGAKELEVLKKMEKRNIHLSEQEILGYCKIFESNKDFLELHQYASIRKIVNYLGKQISKDVKGKAYKLSSDVSGISSAEMKYYQTYIRSWRDYIGWAEKLEYDLKSRYILFPKNFKDVHDKTFQEYQKLENKMERKKQAKERRTVNKLLKKDIKLLDTQIQDKDYLLKVPENYQEIQKEGETLGHCVGSYIPHIANRKCDVYFIRKKTDPDTPFFTVDWRGGKIVQCQGKGRIHYPQEMVEFVCYAEEKLRFLKGEEEKKAA